VQGELSLDPGTDPDNAGDVALVDAAFAALPSPAHAGFGVTRWRVEGELLVAEVAIPKSATGAELFLAGSDGQAFGTPKKIEKDGKLSFQAAVIGRPAQGVVRAGAEYVLVTDQGAVSGILKAP
jgi:DsbC/DsbD-like thiol-disulfide interchange protein